MPIGSEFINPIYFKHLNRSNKWICTLCSGMEKKRKPMSYREALQHERNSRDHGIFVQRQIQEEQAPNWDNAWEAAGPSSSQWFAPSSDQDENHLVTRAQLRGKEHQYFADQVEDMIPFWMAQQEAAERGEVLRLEEFLDSLNDQSWPPRGPDIWTHVDRHSNCGGRPRNGWEPNWGNDLKKWGVDESASSMSAETGGRTGRTGSEAVLASFHTQPHSMSDPKSLVEVVARQNAADENRKREMYSFFELPTNEKVKKIDDLIRALRST